MNEQQENINPNLQRYMELMQKELDLERTKRMGYENELSNNSSFNPIKEPNLVEYQLDLKEELDRIFHLLSGHIIRINQEGSEMWEEPDDDRLKIFSDYGVKQIMNIISFYVNRNTLMSNYDAETIMWKMRDFGIELADLVFNRYEAFFHYPSPEDLYEDMLKIVEKNQLAFPHLIIEHDNGDGTFTTQINQLELYKKCVQWSQQELAQKFRHYPMMILALIDTVHSTYNRALMGKERQSLRERLNISQNASTITDQFQQQGQNKFSVLHPKTW